MRRSGQRRATRIWPALALPLLAGCTQNTFVMLVRQPVALSDPSCDTAPGAPPVTGPGRVVAIGVAPYPRRAMEARIGVGCAGVLFRITPEGRATDLRVMVEDPPGFGFGEAVIEGLEQTRFQPNPDDGTWHYSNATLHLPPSEMPRPYPAHPPGSEPEDSSLHT